MPDLASGPAWRRIIVYRLVLWFVPFVVSLGWITPEGRPRFSDNLFESRMVIVLVPLACVLAYRLFANDRPVPASGLTVGLVWYGCSFICDVPTIILGFGMSWRDYAIDVLLSYLAIPTITIAVAKAAHYRSAASIK